MVKKLGTFGAVERFVWVRDEIDHDRTASAPEDYEVIHCCLLPGLDNDEPWAKLYNVIADATEPVVSTSSTEVVVAACGRYTKVWYPKPFDTADPKACPECVEALD